MRRIITTSAPSMASSIFVGDAQICFRPDTQNHPERAFSVRRRERSRRVWSADEYLNARRGNAECRRQSRLQAVDFLFVFADRHRVEQSLRRMFVRAVAGVDDRRFGNFARADAARPRSNAGRRCSRATSRRDSAPCQSEFRLSRRSKTKR